MTVSPSRPSFDSASLAPGARDLEIEAAALTGLAARVDEGFAQAVQMVLATTGRLVVMGMGKRRPCGPQDRRHPGVHRHPCILCAPAEASHGDLGMVTGADVVLAISNSGEAVNSPPSCPCSSAWAHP